MAEGPFELAAAAADQIAVRTGVTRHDVAVVLGSGWLVAADRIGDVVAELPVASLPGFPLPSVAGHAGTVRSIAQGGRHVLAFLGRVHLYEGHPPATVVHAVRAAVMAGCRIVVLTNAAGGIRPSFSVGDPVLVADHINLTAQSPLTGPLPPPPHDIRFVDMTDAYSPRLRAAARRVDPSLAEGVYACFAGPQFETPAEIRMAAGMGADLAGMSTVLETIAARQLGAEVLACSLVTNLAAGIHAGGDRRGIDHHDVLEVGQRSAQRMGQLLAEVIGAL
ncbi:MAG TPA: purine-nucleoside phosphorylase [Acidimicrobiales bacterium]|nr:purine-nucleoside phosphorylase [Acidimicrobiales bacterium]